MILIEGGRKKGSFNLHATGLQEARLVISLISAVTHSWAPWFVISDILCTRRKKKSEERKLKQNQKENLLWKMTDQRNNFDVTSTAAAFALLFLFG